MQKFEPQEVIYGEEKDILLGFAAEYTVAILKNNGYVPVQLVQELKENKTDAN